MKFLKIHFQDKDGRDLHDTFKMRAEAEKLIEVQLVDETERIKILDIKK